MIVWKYFNKDTKEFITFFTIFLCILWDPIRRYVFPTDGGGRITNVMVLISLLINKERLYEYSNVFKSPAFKIWLILLLYTTINTLCKGYMGTNSEMTLWGFIRKSSFRPVLILVVVMLGMQINRVGCLYLLLITLFLYLFWCNLNLAFWGRDSRRLLSELGNLVPLTSLAFFFVGGTLFCEGKIKKITILGIALFSISVIFVGGTRKALGAFAIELIALAFSRINKMTIFNFVKIITVGVTMYYAFSYVIDHTIIGARILESSEKKAVPLVENEKMNSFFMLLLGDRAKMYLHGLELFNESPITGIGLGNYMYKVGATHILHTEYMVQLAENGLIGFSLLVLFYFVLLRDLRKVGKNRNENMWFYIGGVLAILFINLTAWTYNMMYVMIFYAIIINDLYTTKKERIYENCNL